MNWKRIAKWSAFIFLAAQFIGHSIYYWMNALSVNALSAQSVTRMGVFVSSTTLYYLFLRADLRFRLAHATVAFLLVESFDWSAALLLGAQLSELLANWQPSARHLAAAVLGLAIAQATTRPRKHLTRE
jgi:hypothetical protein